MLGTLRVPEFGPEAGLSYHELRLSREKSMLHLAHRIRKIKVSQRLCKR